LHRSRRTLPVYRVRERLSSQFISKNMGSKSSAHITISNPELSLPPRSLRRYWKEMLSHLELRK
jgi:hypothetical protein